MSLDPFLRPLVTRCAQQLGAGVSADRLRAALRRQGVLPELAALALDHAARGTASLDCLAHVLELAPAGRGLLDSGGTTVDLYLHLQQQCDARLGDPASAPRLARLATEVLASVHAAMAPAPMSEDAFLAAVGDSWRELAAGLPAGGAASLYPLTLPEQFFHDAGSFLDMCHRLGPDCLRVLWQSSPGVTGDIPQGIAHPGRLKDERRYLMLRLPPPGRRFEAHFLAFIAEGAGAPPRMFAMERGVAAEEAVLCEWYSDAGRLRLGAAGPAESKNFIRLVRQQLGL